MHSGSFLWWSTTQRSASPLLSLLLPHCSELDSNQAHYWALYSNLITRLFSLFPRRYPLVPKALVSDAVRGRYNQGPGNSWFLFPVYRITESKLENWGITYSSQALPRSFLMPCFIFSCAQASYFWLQPQMGNLDLFIQVTVIPLSAISLDH